MAKEITDEILVDLIERLVGRKISNDQLSEMKKDPKIHRDLILFARCCVYMTGLFNKSTSYGYVLGRKRRYMPKSKKLRESTANNRAYIIETRQSINAGSFRLEKCPSKR
ncbi:MAG: hypothetical protein FWF85_02730 [Clostridiales bacterium]|nr:hypothetical protein [Clostridiales bacterium]